MSTTRLREMTSKSKAPPHVGVQAVWSETENTISLWFSLQRFKKLISDAETAALQNAGDVPSDAAQESIQAFAGFNELLHSTVQALPTDKQEELGAQVHQEMLPYILLTQAGERFYTKPRGYPGDFWSLELVYRNQPHGTGRIGPIVDRCVLGLQAAQAARNRRLMLGREVMSVVERTAQAQVTTLACGPATELFDVYDQLDKPERLQTNLIDIDMQALAYVAEKRDERNLRHNMNLQPANIVYLATGRQQILLQPQDFVYSLGLIDYFDDQFVVALLDYIHDLLMDGGKVILGNAHVSCCDRAFLDYVLDWRMIYRSEEDMQRLFTESRFARPCAIQFDVTGIQMFAECSKVAK